MRRIITFTLISLMFYSSIHAWELYDRVIAVVNDTPIIESEAIMKFNHLKKVKRIPRRKQDYEMSRLIDKLIEDALVLQKAEQESIIVSDAKVNNQIETIMKRLNISDLEDFKKRIERKQKLSFKAYKEELKISLYREQVISIAIGVSPPTEKEARAWYNKNKRKVGYQVKIKHILIRPKDRSFAEEKRVNKTIKDLRRRVIAGESFESLARKYSQDSSSAAKGGDLGWVLLAELDPYFAAQVFRLRRRGQISPVIKSRSGYHVVKFLGKRVTPFEEISGRIMHLLYQMKTAAQFKKWVSKKKQNSDIKIYMENYVRG